MRVSKVPFSSDARESYVGQLAHPQERLITDQAPPKDLPTGREHSRGRSFYALEAGRPCGRTIRVAFPTLRSSSRHRTRERARDEMVLQNRNDCRHPGAGARHFALNPHLVLVDALSDRRRAGGHGRV